MVRVFALARVALLATAAVAQPIRGEEIRVSDGDTIVAGGKTYRLVGFDTPEIFSPKCETERTLGVRARRRLVELVRGGSLDLTEVRCACRDGEHGTRWCNWGRACGKLTAKGIDVAKTLISERLARPLICSRTKCPKLKSWCT
jgi:endonuclease YncB( thermonuclease family)